MITINCHLHHNNISQWGYKMGKSISLSDKDWIETSKADVTDADGAQSSIFEVSGLAALK